MNHNKQLIILGAGGHAKVCHDIARVMGHWDEILILDDSPENNYFEIVGPFDAVENYPNADFFVAIGSNKIRSKILEELKEKNYKIVTLIHPKAIVAGNVTIGEGSVLMANAIINPSTKVGEGTIINTAVSVDHDNVIGKYNHLSPGCHTAGSVVIGDFAWLGIGSVVSNNITITSDVIVGAGATVTKDLENSGIYIGTPAKLIRE